MAVNAQNFENTDDFRALKVHGCLYNGFSTESESGDSEFDETYYKYKPKPIKIDADKVVVIHSEEPKASENSSLQGTHTQNKAKFASWDNNGSNEHINNKPIVNQPQIQKLTFNNGNISQQTENKLKTNVMNNSVINEPRIASLSSTSSSTTLIQSSVKGYRHNPSSSEDKRLKRNQTKSHKSHKNVGADYDPATHSPRERSLMISRQDILTKDSSSDPQDSCCWEILCCLCQ